MLSDGLIRLIFQMMSSLFSGKVLKITDRILLVQTDNINLNVDNSKNRLTLY